MANVLLAIERSIYRGSSLFNNGYVDLSARLYFTTISSS